MAYSQMPGYPAYQQPYTQPYPDRLAQLQGQYQIMPQQPQINQGLLWVQGEAGAKSYLVAPNTTVLLMDSESQRFYLKSTDGAGMPNLRTFEYSELLPNSVQPLHDNASDLDSKYVTREEYDALKVQCEQILEKIDGLRTDKPARSSKGKGVQTDESFI